MILQRPVERGAVSARYSKGTLLVQLGEGAEEACKATVVAYERRHGLALSLDRELSSHVLLSCSCGWETTGPVHWLKARTSCPSCEGSLSSRDVGQEVRVYRATQAKATQAKVTQA